MSHIVTIKTQVRDAAAVTAACDRLALPPPQHGQHELFSGSAEGLAVQLREWRYPLVCQLDTGQLQYDDYGGRWGAQERLDELLQIYAVEKAKLEARRQGHQATEQLLSDGSVQVSIELGGAT